MQWGLITTTRDAIVSMCSDVVDEGRIERLVAGLGRLNSEIELDNSLSVSMTHSAECVYEFITKDEKRERPTTGCDNGVRC